MPNVLRSATQRIQSAYGDEREVVRDRDVLRSEEGQIPVQQRAWSIEVLSSPAEIRNLSEPAARLVPDRNSTSDPRFFLASIDQKRWIPRVVTITSAGKLVGIVYAKERKFAGIPTGIIYADATLDAMVVSASGYRERVFEMSVQRLLDFKGIRGLRILIPPEGFEYATIQKISGSRVLDVSHTRVENHSVLQLPHRYDLFLDNLGKKTRRNFRYYRRRFEALGCFVAEVPTSEFEHVASELLKKAVVGADRAGANRALAMLSASSRPIRIGLKHKNGEWLSILGGWYEFDRAMVFFQMNDDRDHPHSALSVVMRGYLIENLIAEGVPNLLFWAGTGSPLDRYCRFLPTIGVHLDTPSFVWRISRRTISWSTGLLPERMRPLASWIAPREHPLDSKIVKDSRAFRLLRSWVMRAEGWWFDRTRNVQTAGGAALHNLTLAGSAKSGFEYLPTRPAVARQALKRLPIQHHSEYTFVDLGSGKGRVLFLAEEYPFRKIQGVEFALELHQQTVNNIERYSSPKRHCRQIDSMNIDAADYRFPEGNLVVYLFNPFGPDVMRKVFANLEASIERYPRHVVLVVVNPEFASEVDAIPLFQPYLRTPRYAIYQTVQP